MDDKPIKRCLVDGCEGRPAKKHYCDYHYYRFKTYGVPTIIVKHRATLAEGKRCAKCGAILPLTEFHVARRNKQHQSRDRQGYCKSCVLVDLKERRRKLRNDVISAYGSRCVCCGESREEFLTIDHINGGGNAHRKSLVNMSSTTFYQWLKSNEFPKQGFRCLCANCNFARGYRGYCPHEREREAVG